MSKEPRRKPGTKPRGTKAPKQGLVRGEAIVKRVLMATLEELALVGYGALRVEDVAARAAVNKTTVYRRWPEKVALVRDAFSCMAAAKFVAPETGSLRNDLLAFGRALVEVSSSPNGQSLVRMLVAEGNDAEVTDIKKSLRRERLSVPLRVLANAVARAELAASVDIQLLFVACVGAIQHKIFFMNEAVTDHFLEALVDMLLNGVTASSPRKRAAAPRTKPRAKRVRRAPVPQ
jgi:AcrR family transcriptional regulator